MTSESGSPFGGRPWTLLLGPGARLGELIPLIEALLPADHVGVRPTLERLEDLDGLFCEFPESGRIVLDAEHLPREEVGLVLRFLERHPRWRMHLLDEDPTGGAARRLLRTEGVDWLPAPVEVRALHDLVQPPEAGPALASSPDPVRTATAPAPSAAGDLGDDRSAAEPIHERSHEEPEDESGGLSPELLGHIQRILDGEPVGAAPLAEPPIATPAPEPPAGEPVAPEADLPDADLGPRVVPPFLGPPAYFKNQVADLADIVQCVDLELGMAGEEAGRGEGAPAAGLARRLEELSAEIARLRHYTQTLSYLASPPGVGSQLIDLAPLLQEMLAARRTEADTPRYLLRCEGPLTVRSDKRLLAQALDALLFLSHHAAGPEGTVRVDSRVEARAAEELDEVRISVRFPAGPIGEVEPARIMEPYALRRILPELGANSLAAAAGILAGQGGSLALRAERDGDLEWIVRLPRASGR